MLASAAWIRRRAAYSRLFDHPDPKVRLDAARRWCAWEDAVIAHETAGSPGQYSAKPDTAMLTFTRICAHYFTHAAWLPDGQLLRDAHPLAGIPGVLIHGKLDLSAPLRTAWELSKVWPDAELQIIDDSGHTGSPAMSEAVLSAVARFGAFRYGDNRRTISFSSRGSSGEHGCDRPVRRNPLRR